MPDFFAYCPQCKSEKISKDERKYYYCSNCGFTYYHNVASACALIIEHDRKVLFTIRKFDPAKNMLDLPGGFVDYHESVEEALKREIKEELNLKVVGFRFMASFPNQYIYKEIEYHTLDFIFITQLKSLENIKVGDDVSRYVLKSIEEIDPDEIGLDSIKRAIEYYRVNRH